MKKRPGSKRKILVALDFSADSQSELERAMELARSLGEAEVRALHVIDLGALERHGTKKTGPARKAVDELEAKAHSNLREWLLEADPEKKFVRAAEVVTGKPADEIVAYAETKGADLIVLGTRGQTGLTRLLAGSTAERVVRLAPCDVLVVKNGGAP